MSCCVHILASKRNGTLYVGATSELKKRIQEHKHSIYECTNDMTSAITREKQIKKWNRKWKFALIEKENPAWQDVYEKL